MRYIIIALILFLAAPAWAEDVRDSWRDGRSWTSLEVEDGKYFITRLMEDGWREIKLTTSEAMLISTADDPERVTKIILENHKAKTDRQLNEYVVEGMKIECHQQPVPLVSTEPGPWKCHEDEYGIIQCSDSWVILEGFDAFYPVLIIDPVKTGKSTWTLGVDPWPLFIYYDEEGNNRQILYTEVPDMNGDGVIDEQDKRLAEYAMEEFRKKWNKPDGPRYWNDGDVEFDPGGWKDNENGIDLDVKNIPGTIQHFNEFGPIMMYQDSQYQVIH